MQENPFAAPSSPIHATLAEPTHSVGILALEDNKIVCGDSVRLPAICVKTGRSDDLVKVKKKLYWAPKWVGFLILLNLLILLVVYMIVRKQVDVVYYIDRSARSSLRLKNAIGVLLFIAGLVGMIAAAVAEHPAMFVGLIALIVGLSMVVKFGNVLKPVAHKDGIFRLQGFGEEFLRVVGESIPR